MSASTKRNIVIEKIYKINDQLNSATCYQHGLLGGTLGLLFYDYNAGRLLQEPSLGDKGLALLENVFDDVNTEGGLVGAAYSNGAAGLGYVVNYLQANDFIDFDIDTEFADLDEYLLEEGIKLFSSDNIDYLHGAAGIFYYFASRQQTATVNKQLNVLAQHFLDKAIFTNEGVRFCNLGLERLTIDHVDFGLAHGLCGLSLILLYALPYLKQQAKAIEVVKGSIDFILKQKVAASPAQGQYSCFPIEMLLQTGRVHRYSRLAWCYGDLNEVLLLCRASNWITNTNYKYIAEKVGIYSTSRKAPGETMSIDSHFCHGSAGLATYYKTLYAETANKNYLEAYEYWINTTVNLVDKEMAEGRYKENPAGLLEGWAGVALVLADYVSEIKVEWSKVFLL
jgi:lantibiotic biosynthesis protein